LPNYGIHGPNGLPVVDKKEAIRLVHAAVDSGINFFDTARGYGESESVLGEALANQNDCIIATKVSVPDDSLQSPSEQSFFVGKSLEASLRALRRDRLDIVQVHDATPEVLEETEVLSVLGRARREGKVRFLGASVDGEDAALAAIRTGCVDMLQIAVNLLDQRMLAKIVPEASKANIGILSCSTFLKGALTEKAKLLPSSFRALSEAVNCVREELRETWEGLPRVAVRFCLSVPGIHSVLVGLRNLTELLAVLEAEASEPLEEGVIHKIDALKLSDESLLNPSYLLAS